MTGAGAQPADSSAGRRREGTGEGSPVFSHSPHIHLAVPIIQGSVHEHALPASPSCEKWVMEFKGARSLVAAACGCFLANTQMPRTCVCVCSSVSCSEIHKAVFGMCVSESEVLPHLSGCVCISVCLLSKLPYILPHNLH